MQKKADILNQAVKYHSLSLLNRQIFVFNLARGIIKRKPAGSFGSSIETTSRQLVTKPLR